MWLLMGILACAEMLGLRVGQSDLETLGDCKSEDDAVALFVDEDGDGYGAGTVPEAWGCLPLEGFVKDGGDCSDHDPDVAPGKPEVCNNIDDDCDFTVDDAPDVLWCVDEDGDGFGDPDRDQVRACEAPPERVLDCSDCDDDDDTVGGGCGL
jgi:hypothetical protein